MRSENVMSYQIENPSVVCNYLSLRDILLVLALSMSELN